MFSIPFVNFCLLYSNINFIDSVRIQESVRILLILNKVTPFLNINHFLLLKTLDKYNSTINMTFSQFNLLLTYMFKISFLWRSEFICFRTCTDLFLFTKFKWWRQVWQFKLKIPYYSVLFTKYRFLCPGNVLHILFHGSMRVNRFVENKKVEGILIFSSPFFIETCNTFRPALSANQNA